MIGVYEGVACKKCTLRNSRVWIGSLESVKCSVKCVAGCRGTTSRSTDEITQNLKDEACVKHDDDVIIMIILIIVIIIISR